MKADIIIDIGKEPFWRQVAQPVEPLSMLPP